VINKEEGVLSVVKRIFGDEREGKKKRKLMDCASNGQTRPRSNPLAAGHEVQPKAMKKGKGCQRKIQKKN